MFVPKTTAISAFSQKWQEPDKDINCNMRMRESFYGQSEQMSRHMGQHMYRVVVLPSWSQDSKQLWFLFMSHTASQLFCNQGCRISLRLLQHCGQVPLSWMGPATGNQCRVTRRKTSAGWRKSALLHSGWAAEIRLQMQTNQRGGSWSSQSARWQKTELLLEGEQTYPPDVL